MQFKWEPNIMRRFALALVDWTVQIDEVIFVMELPIKNRAERVVWDAKEVQSWTTSSSSGLEFIEWKSGIVTRRVWDRDTPRHRGTPWHLLWDTGVEDDSASEEICRVLIFSNGSSTINSLYHKPIASVSFWSPPPWPPWALKDRKWALPQCNGCKCRLSVGKL